MDKVERDDDSHYWDIRVAWPEEKGDVFLEVLESLQLGYEFDTIPLHYARRIDQLDLAARGLRKYPQVSGDDDEDDDDGENPSIQNFFARLDDGEAYDNVKKDFRKVPHCDLLMMFYRDLQGSWELSNDPVGEYNSGNIPESERPVEIFEALPETIGELRAALEAFPPETPISFYDYLFKVNKDMRLLKFGDIGEITFVNEDEG